MMSRNALKWTAYIAAGAMTIGLSLPFVTQLVRDDAGGEWARTRGVDPATFAAQESARIKFSHFLEKFETANGVTDEFTVKARLYSKNGTPIVLWMDQIEISGKTISGRIANEPLDELKDGLSYGDYTDISIIDVMDWSYPENGLLRGNYTLRAYARTRPDVERYALLQALHEEPLP